MCVCVCVCMYVCMCVSIALDAGGMMCVTDEDGEVYGLRRDRVVDVQGVCVYVCMYVRMYVCMYACD